MSHTCDPTGMESCPPWAHPYPTTGEVLEKQEAIAAQRAAERERRAPRTMLPAKGASVAAIRLIQECALDARSAEELAAEFGVTGPAIHYFKKRNAYAIADARQNIESEIAGLWISKLHNRLAELQSDVELSNERLETTESAADCEKWLRAKHRAIRDAAEQLGQLTPRQINVGTTVRYEIAGVDLDRLA